MKPQIPQSAMNPPPNLKTAVADQWRTGAISDDLTSKLFTKMQALYGARFNDQWRKVELGAMRRHWGIALGKLTVEQIRRGMALLETLDLPPTLPQFIKLCKPALDPQAAYFEAVAGINAREHGQAGVWSDPAIYWATTVIGAFDLKNQAYAQICRRWQAALADAQANPRNELIPAPDAKLPESDEVAMPQDKAPEIVAIEVAAKLTRPAAHNDDPKRWAKRIQERIAIGDKTVTRQQARAAKAALGDNK
jgi:hypothetical protein